MLKRVICGPGYDEIRSCIMSYLYPIDIVSLTNALGIRPNRMERAVYAKPINQIFHSLDWATSAKQNNITVTVVGKDLHALKIGIDSWDYDAIPKIINLLIVILRGDITKEREYPEEEKYIEERDRIIQHLNGNRHANNTFSPIQIKYISSHSNMASCIYIVSCFRRRVNIDSTLAENIFSAYTISH